MSKGTRFLCLVIVLSLIACMGLSAQEIKKSATPAYLLSIFVGFGTGHFYIGDEKAKTFLGWEVAAAGTMIAGSVVYSVALLNMTDDILYGDLTSTFSTGVIVGLGLVVVGSIATSGLRIWELVDIFGAVDEKRAEGKIAVAPSLELTSDKVSVGISLGY